MWIVYANSLWKTFVKKVQLKKMRQFPRWSSTPSFLPVTEAAPVRLLLMLMLLDRVLRRGPRCAHRASRAGDTLQAPRQLEHLCAESVKGEHGRGWRLAFRKPEFVSVQCRQLGVCRRAGSVLRCTAASGRAFAQQKSLPRAFPVQPWNRKKIKLVEILLCTVHVYALPDSEELLRKFGLRKIEINQRFFFIMLSFFLMRLRLG